MLPQPPRSLVLSPAEWQVLCESFRFSLPHPGDMQRASAAARASAKESLLARNIIAAGGSRVAEPVAALLFSLAHPGTAVWAGPHGSGRHIVQVSLNKRVSAIAWQDDEKVRVAHTTRARAPGDLASLVAGGQGTTPTGGTFSLAGGLWHELLTQAPVASDRALESLARAEGVAEPRLELVAGLAKSAAGRIDLRCTRPSSTRSWSGGEVSLLATHGDVWTVNDGRAFGGAGKRASSRAIFTNVDPRELLARLMSS